MIVSKIKTTLIELLVVICMIAILAALMWPAQVKAQPTSLSPYQPNYVTTPTNMTATGFFTNTGSFSLTNGQYLLISGCADTIRQYNGESILASLTWTNPLTVGAGLTTWWNVAADNTNYTTTQPFVFTIPSGAGSNTVVWWTNLTFLQLDNVRNLKLYAMSNNLVGTGPGTNTMTVNWLQFSRSQEIKY